MPKNELPFEPTLDEVEKQQFAEMGEGMGTRVKKGEKMVPPYQFRKNLGLFYDELSEMAKVHPIIFLGPMILGTTWVVGWLMPTIIREVERINWMAGK